MTPCSSSRSRRSSRPLRDGHAGVLRVAPGGEGVERRVVDDVDLGLGHVGSEAQLAHHVDQLRRLGLADLPRLRDAQHHAVPAVEGRQAQAGRDQPADGHEEDGVGWISGEVEADEPAERRRRWRRRSAISRMERRLLERICSWKVSRASVMARTSAHGGRPSRARCASGPYAVGFSSSLPKPRSTLGTCSASGSASKNSRLLKPSGPAMRTLGKVAMEVL